VTTDDRDRDLLRQLRLELRDLTYDGHDRKPGAAKAKKQRVNRSKRRKRNQWIALALLR
jgi:hypothetical protein